WVSSIGALKRVEDSEGPVGRQLVHRADIGLPAAGLRRAVQVAHAVSDQASKWVGTIGAVKLEEDSKGPAGRQLVHRAVPGRPAAERRAVQGARAVLDQTSRWVASIGVVVKRVEDSKGPAGLQLVHRAGPRHPAVCRAVQGARAVLDQTSIWVASIGAVKRVEDS